MKPFNRRKSELSVQDGCILWGNRVVVPEQGRSKVLQQLHEGHPGVTRMKSIARSLTWWPGIDKDIEKTVQNCQPCHQKSPASEVTSSSTTTPLGMARSPLGKAAY